MTAELVALRLLITAFAGWMNREPAALVIAKPKAPPYELLFQDAVLFDGVLDDFGLLALDPVFVRRQREGVEGGSSHGSCPEFMAT